jgi:hypothetical protein
MSYSSLAGMFGNFSGFGPTSAGGGGQLGDVAMSQDMMTAQASGRPILSRLTGMPKQSIVQDKFFYLRTLIYIFVPLKLGSLSCSNNENFFIFFYVVIRIPLFYRNRHNSNKLTTFLIFSIVYFSKKNLYNLVIIIIYFIH